MSFLPENLQDILSGIIFITNQTSEILRYNIQNRIEYFSGPGQYINTRF